MIASHVVFDMIFVAAIVRTRLGYFDRIGRGGGAGPGREPTATFFRVTSR